MPLQTAAPEDPWSVIKAGDDVAGAELVSDQLPFTICIPISATAKMATSSAAVIRGFTSFPHLRSRLTIEAISASDRYGQSASAGTAGKVYSHSGQMTAARSTTSAHAGQLFT